MCRYHSADKRMGSCARNLLEAFTGHWSDQTSRQRLWSSRRTAL